MIKDIFKATHVCITRITPTCSDLEEKIQILKNPLLKQEVEREVQR